MNRPPALVLGPGPRLAALARCLCMADGGAPPIVSDLFDAVAALRDTVSRSGVMGMGTTLVLDVDSVPSEDLGLLRRLRTAVPGLAVCWTASAAEAPRLAGLVEGTDRILPWPLDVTTLPGVGRDAETSAPAAQTIRPRNGKVGTIERAATTSSPLAGTRRADPTEARPRRAPLAGATAPLGRESHFMCELDPELAHIEAILGSTGSRPRGATSTTGRPRAESVKLRATQPSPVAKVHDLDVGELVDFEDEGASRAEFQALAGLGPLLTTEEMDAFTAPDPVEAGVALAAPGSPVAPGDLVQPHLPRWYRRQIADLADLVQRSELALLSVESERNERVLEDGVRERDLTPLRTELARLRQFARTLGCVAAPPGAADTVVDLGVLVEETLASLSQHAEGGTPVGRPRFLFRAEPGLEVRADKGLLVAALDAVVQVAAAAGGPNDVVRTEVLGTDAGVVEVRIDLPQGRLAGLEPATILEPYSLERRLPGIGPNALAAAGGILVGHGGDLWLERRIPGRFLFGLRLPVARR